MKPVTIQSLEQAHCRRRLSITLFVILSVLTALLIGSLFLVQAYAASGETDDQTVISWIEATNLPRNNIMSFIFRHIGWAVICGLRFLVNGIQYVVFTVTSNMGNLFSSTAVNDPSGWGKGVLAAPLQTIVAVFAGLVALVVLGIGILFVVKPQKVSEIAIHICIGVVVAVSLPIFVGGAFSLTSQLTAALPGSGTPLADQLLMNNTYDVLKLDNADLLKQIAADPASDSNPGALAQMKASGQLKPTGMDTDYTLEKIDPTEMCGLDGWWDDNATVEDKFWGNTVSTASDGTKSLKGLGDGKPGDDGSSGTILSTQYYRWNFDWLNLIVSLLVMGFALIMCGIKLIRILFELVVKQLLGQILAFLDIRTMQRLKKCLYSIVSSCAAFFGTFLMLQLYINAQQWIGLWSNGNFFAKILLQIALGWAVIDGPDIFEKLFGMDIGVKSAMGTLYGLQTIGRAAGAAGKGIFGSRMPDGSRQGGLLGKKGVVDIASRAASKAAGGIGAAGGFVAGKAGAAKLARTMRSSGTGAAAPHASGTATPAGNGAAHNAPAPSASNEPAGGPQAPASTNPAPLASQSNGFSAVRNAAADAALHHCGKPAAPDTPVPTGAGSPSSEPSSPDDSNTVQEPSDAFAQDEYAKEQNQAAYEERGYGETTGEYLHKRFANFKTNLPDNRFTHPIHTTRRAYNLSRNSALKYILDKK